MSDVIEIADEVEVNAVIDATPVLDDQPTMSPVVLWAFCVDCAQNIMPYREIATRYGFVDVAQLKLFLLSQHAIRKKVKEIRAVYESDDNVEAKVKKLAGTAVLHALPEIAKIMINPRNPDPIRLDATTKIAKLAGMGHAPQQGNGGSDGPGRFSVNIMFANGKTETITTIERQPEPEEL